MWRALHGRRAGGKGAPSSKRYSVLWPVSHCAIKYVRRCWIQWVKRLIQMIEKSKVRVAMIGAGGMANNVHYPSLASFADVEIAAICDLDEQRLQTTADKYNVQGRYTNYRKMV